jgi:hypothetical protein
VRVTSDLIVIMALDLCSVELSGPFHVCSVQGVRYVVAAPPEMMCLPPAAPHSFSVTWLTAQYLRASAVKDIFGPPGGIDEPLSGSESLQTIGDVSQSLRK